MVKLQIKHILFFLIFLWNISIQAQRHLIGDVTINKERPRKPNKQPFSNKFSPKHSNEVNMMQHIIWIIPWNPVLTSTNSLIGFFCLYFSQVF